MILDFRGPKCERILFGGLFRGLRSDWSRFGCAGGLFCLLAILVTERAPFEIDYTLNLDTLLCQKAHARQFIDADLLSRGYTSDIFIVPAPFQGRPSHALFLLRVVDRPCSRRRGDGRECAQKIARFNFPDGDAVAFVLWTEKLRSLQGTFWDNNGFVRPSNEVLFAWRKIEELDEWVSEALQGLPCRPAPEADALTVKRGEQGSTR